ncbi:hypothetical protein CC99x_002540 [Candidatus Berkiella cookevillensis]|uniref:Uncharacterized protein n=1 Tax=Candidatus Berkiella cookevillensis TaxID=437022 RepID=A0A0Q9Y8W3_9GAMM|nr:hypothetical protein [Candidatus Berkiella cookevillensis]MCS5707777.1 hypothetical protein [Candidatus Berkiella cookevillensis]
MKMHKVLISMPEDVYVRMRASIPERQRSKVFTRLIESELAKQEEAIYQAALALEKDAAALIEVMEINKAFANDGLENDVFDESVFQEQDPNAKSRG